LDFFKKYNLLRTVAVEHAPAAEKKGIETVFKGITKQNDHRILMAHCRFEAARKEGVQFRRTVAKDGKVKNDDQLWPKEKFESECKKLEDLRAKLNGLKPTLVLRVGEDGTTVLLTRFMLDDPGNLKRTWAAFYS
jgi:hypothetical protein